MNRHDVTIHIRNCVDGRVSETFYIPGAHEVHRVSEPLVPITPQSAPGHRTMLEVETYDLELVKADIPQLTNGPGDHLKRLLPSYSEQEITMMARAYLLEMSLEEVTL